MDKRRIRRRIMGMGVLFTLLPPFLLSGCAGRETKGIEADGQAPGTLAGYTQYEIGLPEDLLQTSYTVLGFHQTENQTQELYVYNQNHSAFEKYSFSGSSEWEASSCEWLDNALGEVAPASVDVLFQDGIYYAKYEGENGKCHLIQSEDEKSAEEIPIAGWDRREGSVYYPVVDRVAVLSDRVIASTRADSICQIHERGTVVGEFHCGEPYSLAGFGEYVAVLSEGNTGVCIYHMGRMEIEKEIRFASPDGDIPQLFMKNEVSVYLAGKEGLKELKLDSGEAHLVIDGAKTMFSYGGYFPMWLETTPDGDFYVLFVDRDQSDARLMKYSRALEGRDGQTGTFGESGSSGPDGGAQGDGLEIYSLQDNELIRSAINHFNVKYPSVKIQYEVAKGENGAATDSDLIRALNARMEAGNGPDILILDDMPLDSYVEKGLLADLSGILSESDVAANLLKAYGQGGQIFAIPTRIGLPIILGTDDVMENADDLSALAAYADQAKLPYYVEGTVTYRTLIDHFYPLYINSILEDKKVNQTRLKAFLSDIKKIADSVKAVEASDFDNSRPARWLGLGDTSFAIAVMRGMLFDQATELLSYAKQNGDYRAVDHLFMPYGLLGVNERSGQKELAAQFVLEALDLQVQQTEYLGAGFPVTNAALAKWRDNESNRGGAILDPNTGSEISFDWPDAGMRQRLFRELSEVETPILQDGIVEEKLMTIGEQYLRGGMTVEAAVQEITDEVEVYLQE